MTEIIGLAGTANALFQPQQQRPSAKAAPVQEHAPTGFTDGDILSVKEGATPLAAEQRAPSASEVFSAMDSNGDGQVDTGELTSYAALPPAAPPHGAGGAIPEMAGGAVPEMAKPDEDLAALISALSEG